MLKERRTRMKIGGGGGEGQDRDKDKTSAVRDKLNKRSQQQPEGGGRRGPGIAHNKKNKNNGIDNV